MLGEGGDHYSVGWGCASRSLFYRGKDKSLLYSKKSLFYMGAGEITVSQAKQSTVL